MLTLADIEAARERIADGIYESPCVESIPLSELTGARIWCKLDYLQRTGSFSQALSLSAGLSLLSAAAYLLLIRQPIHADAAEPVERI